MGHGGTVSEPPVSDGQAPHITRPAVGQGGVYPKIRDTVPTGNASSALGNSPFEGNGGMSVGADKDDVLFRDARSCSGIGTIL